MSRQSQLYQAYRNSLAELYDLFLSKKSLLLPTITEKEREVLQRAEKLRKRVRRYE